MRAQLCGRISSADGFASKYLPDHDDVFAEIDLRVPQAQFVFLTRIASVAADFQKRVDRAFCNAGLRATDHVVLLRHTYNFDYWNLNLVPDVFLESLELSGCNSTMEAIACKLPVVTTPGRFMRGRHSSAIRTQLGMGDSVARNKRVYVEYAVRLCRNREVRDSVIRRINDS